MIVLDETIQKLLGLLELKLSLVLSSNIRLFKDLLLEEIIKCLNNFVVMFAQILCLLRV